MKSSWYTPTVSEAISTVLWQALLKREECVAREVWEETHIRIKDIRYYGSQPWPYPCGLMVGFTAQYESGTLLLQKEELGGGGWFTLNNLPELPAQGSIAREMIDDWISEQNNREQ